jgi:hypothetical protein
MLRMSLVVALALASLVASGCSSDQSADEGASGDRLLTSEQTTPPDSTPKASVALRGSARNTGPWVTALSLKLPGNLTPRSFFICAAWKPVGRARPCRAVAGAKLPTGTTLRLEQHPIGPAPANPDNPSWGTVGSSDTAELEAPLSNFVSGDRPGKITYRATLRTTSGKILATSNPVTITWQE